MATFARKVLIADQVLTGSYADIGGENDVSNETIVCIYIAADVNLSEDVLLKGVGLNETGGTEYDIDGYSETTLWTSGASDFNKGYEFDTGAYPIIKFKVIAGTVGGTPGEISAVLTKRHE